jgi:hypothetical protein
MRTMMIGSGGAVAAATSRGAWVVSPSSMGVGLLEFHQMDRMVESGRAAVRALLERADGDLRSSPTEDRLPDLSPAPALRTAALPTDTPRRQEANGQPSTMPGVRPGSM